MRAILLESNPEIALALPCVFDGLGIPLTVVGTVDAVRRATQNVAFDDFIIIDCSLDRAEDRARCLAVVRQVSLDVHIVYAPVAPSHATFRRDIECVARGDLKWLPATVGLLELVITLRDLRDQALQARVLLISRQRPLTEHQRLVWALIVAGNSHADIAKEMGSSKGSISKDVARIKDKIGVDTTEQLKVSYRWVPDK